MLKTRRWIVNPVLGVVNPISDVCGLAGPMGVRRRRSHTGAVHVRCTARVRSPLTPPTHAPHQLLTALDSRRIEGGDRRGLDIEALVAGRPQELNENGELMLFRVGDTVATRNIHAAVYDSLPPCRGF